MEKSEQSGGKADDSPPTALLYDFVPCDDTIRPAHAKLIGLIRTRLGWSSNQRWGHLLQVLGTMDEIETFVAGARGLDEQRARRVLYALDPNRIFTGPDIATDDHPDVVGAGLGMSGDPDARAAGRSVFVKYSVEKKPPPKPKPKSKPGTKWSLSTTSTVATGVDPSAKDKVDVAIGFTLTNETTGQTHQAVFEGVGKGVAIGGSWPLPLPLPLGKFSTLPVRAHQFEGSGAVVRSFAASATLGFGASVGDIKLPHVDTSPERIPISSVELSVGLPLGGFIVTGTFTVL